MGEQVTNGPEPRARGGGGKTLLIFTAVGVLLFSGVGLWLAYLNAPVTFVAPTPAMPSPNARDYYISGANAIVDQPLIDAAVAVVKPRQSRRTSYRAAGRPLSWADKQTLVMRNARAMALVRQGFSFGYMNRFGGSLLAPDREFGRFKGMGRLMELDALVKAHEGSYGAGLDTCMDACEMGANIPRGGPLDAALAGAACQSAGRAAAWDIVDKLDAASARRNARRMERILAGSVSTVDVMTEEKWATASAIARELNIRPSFREFFRVRPSARNWFNGVVLYMEYLTVNKQGILDDYLAYADSTVALCRKPYPARKPRPQVPAGPLADSLCTTVGKEDFEIERNRALNSMLMVALALRAYQVEHGVLPGTLQKLVPGYLASLPADPFALKGTFGYRRKGTRYVLYSIGPDGIDNGGTPHGPPWGGSRRRDSMSTDPVSRGDIVAGVNGN